MPDATTPRKLLDQYEASGFCGPLKAFKEYELRETAALVLKEVAEKEDITHTKRNRHLDLEPVRRLTRAPAIVQAATHILGPDLILWRTHLFVRSAGLGLGWHQDIYTQQLSDPVNHLSIHLGITEAIENNCVMVIPGSHKMTLEELKEAGLVPFKDSNGKDYGAQGFYRNPERVLKVKKMLLRPGEFFVFHPRLVHASSDVTAPVHAPQAGAARGNTEASGFVRLGIGMRITVPGNTILPEAFAETASRGDYAVKLTVK